MRQGRGDEEDEVAAGDGGLEGVGVVHVRLEQPQPLRRAGERPEQPRLLLVRCTYANETKQAHEGRSSDDMHGPMGERVLGGAAWMIGIRYTEAPQGGVDDAASAEELPDEPAPEVAAAAGDTHHRAATAPPIPLALLPFLLKKLLFDCLCFYWPSRLPARCSKTATHFRSAEQPLFCTKSFLSRARKKRSKLRRYVNSKANRTARET